MTILGIFNALEKLNERLTMINYQFIVKYECQSFSFTEYEETLNSSSWRAEKPVNQEKNKDNRF